MPAKTPPKNSDTTKNQETTETATPKSPTPAPTPKSQFPTDPNRAAEAGYNYGWAAPEKPGKRMATPPLFPEKPEPSANERAADAADAEEQREEQHNRELDEKLSAETEKLGPRGNFRS